MVIDDSTRVPSSFTMAPVNLLSLDLLCLIFEEVSGHAVSDARPANVST